MTTINRICLVLAAIGLASSVAMHVLSFADIAMPAHVWQLEILFYGMLGLLPPAIIASHALIKGYPRKEWRKVSLRGMPSWVARCLGPFQIYSVAGFVLYQFVRLGQDEALVNQRLLSCFFLLCYGTATAMFWSAVRAKAPDRG